MIKELNPRALNFYCERYAPKVLLLFRHPAAIALSFYRLGWLSSSDTQMDTNNTHANIWEKFGYAYGLIMHDAVINKYYYSSKDSADRGEIERTSRNMVFKWRSELTDQQVSGLRTGFLQSKLEYYRDEKDWMPEDFGLHS